MQCSSRRDFLKAAGGTALGVVAFSGLTGAVLSCAPQSAQDKSATPGSVTPSPSPSIVPAKLPWPYKKLDPAAAAERAYAAYYNGGCMYGAFEGIVGELRAQVGPPYDMFPTEMTKYGAAGVSGWGTLCGCLNGAAAAIYLVHLGATGNPIINEVYGWYAVTPLPDYKPAKPKFDSIEKSVSDSPLCHASVSNWCTKTGVKATSPERAERCAWLTASTVRYTVDLLNKQADGTFQKTFANPASVTGCLSCHGKGSALENVHTSNQTTCTTCHSVLPGSHPAPAK